ncbi:MAG: DEAD/DEAH box helicase, partial [Clostridia bacterium]
EIIHQIKNYIVKYVHGKKDTVGKTEDELIKEVFPNIEFTTYPNLIAKGGKEIINTHYGLIIADELHRTGAKEWESSIDKLYENQNENVKVLGITATPVRDVDERDMAEETARKLGYTNDEIKHRKHIASNMTLENAIRMGYVVNPKLVYCKYDLITSGKLDQLKEKIEIIEDESKKAEELEIYNELKSKVNREIDDEIEETARKHLNSGIGKEQILRQNVKKGGKYIVFIPITNQEKIEDENGNRIGEKTGEDKIKAYQDYLTQVFKDTDITPIYNSLLGSYTKEKNRQELNEFEARITDETSFMIVMNKANEGLHIEGIDGIVWFRALDENSRILYLQQLGRAIYALDEDNPISENNRPIVIDLVNNSLTVKIEKDFKNMKSIDDLEALAIVTEWMEEHDGIFPSSTSSNKQEQHYYAILRRIQNTYNKYLNGFENFEDLDESEKEQIQEIIEIAASIDLWNVELPPIPKTKGSKNEMDPFEITGILRDYLELEEKVNSIEGKSPFEQVMQFCEREGRVPKYVNKKALEQSKEEKEEQRLYFKWLNTEERKIVDGYEGKSLEEIPEEDRELVKTMKSYGYGLTPYQEVMQFCEREGRVPKYVNKKASEQTKEEKEEQSLYNKWLNTEEKKIVDSYKGRALEEIPQEYRELVKTMRNYGYGLVNELTPYQEVVQFCEREGRVPKYVNKKALKQSKEEKEEQRLYYKWLNTEERKIVDGYEGKALEEIPEEDRELVRTMRSYGYGFGNGLTPYQEVVQFCEREGRVPKQVQKKVSEQTKEEKEENSLYKKWKITEEKKIVDSYKGKALEEIPQEYRELVRTMRSYGTGLTQYQEVMQFCEREGRVPKQSNKKASEQTKEEKEENSLYQKWLNTEEKKIVDGYEGKSLEEIPQEYRELVKTMRNYRYGLGNGLTPYQEVMQFCEREGRLPRTATEKNLYKKWLRTKEKKIVDSYKGRALEEIPEEDRELVKTMRSYGYGLYKKITGQDVGKASYSANVEMCDQAQEVIDNLIQKTKEGGIIHGSN